MAPTQQQTQRQQAGPPAVQEQRQNLPAIAPAHIPFHPIAETRFGIDKTGWYALVDAVFPNAKTVEGVLMALAYCRAHNLDIFKRVVHIVSIWSKEKNRYVESVWPGIQLLRTTAFRTGQYVGKRETECGPLITRTYQTKYNGEVTIEVPEWMRVTIYRRVAGEKCEFTGPKVYWDETYTRAGRDTVEPNDMWIKRPNGQLEKCAEAASLRSAFPEDIGDYIPEEIERSDARPAASIETLDVKFTELPPQALPDNRADQEELQAVMTAADNLTAHDEPEPVPVRQQAAKKAEPPKQAAPVAAGGPPPDSLDELEVWLVNRYQSAEILKNDHDVILESYDSSQYADVVKMIRKRIAQLEKPA